MARNVLEVNNLKTQFFTRAGIVYAVDGVSFHVGEGETLGIVGESGCGKSVTATSVMRLIPSPPGRIVEGEILLDDGKERVDILTLDDGEMRHIRGNRIAMIFQDPMTSLNPVLTVGDQLTEPLMLHMGMTRREADARAVELLKRVGIPGAEDRMRAYPHQFSGGMRQRVMIAIALSCNPKVLIADEPTTALDVTIQAQILELLKTIQERTKSALMLITHDLGVVAEMVDHIVVMYAGQIVEQGTAEAVLLAPKAPYTMGLLESIPTVDKRGGRLSVITGTVPSPFNMPPACRFEPRCPYSWELCRQVPPDLYRAGSAGQLARCHLHTPAGEGRLGRALDTHTEAMNVGSGIGDV